MSEAHVIPEPGRFLPDRQLADALSHHLRALEQERQWCGNRRAEPRIVNAIHEIETAIDLLRAEWRR